MGFESIIGHEKIIKRLQTSIRKNKISHSYLFVGEESIGKKMVASKFAKAILCKENLINPCNYCSSCVKFNTGNHPDFFLIDSDNAYIRKGQVENIIENVMTKPIESEKKIFIINDSYKMNKAAQNSFLKTLEEPPKFVIFILISTKSSNLLPTIVSRCKIVKFFPTKTEEVVELLTTKYDKSLEDGKIISSFARNRVGKAIELASSEAFFEKRDEAIELVDKIIKGDKIKIFQAQDFLNENKKNIEEILDIILYWFRDLLIYKELGESSLLVNEDKVDLLSTETFLPKRKINDIINMVQETRHDIKQNVNYSLALEVMLLKMQEV